MLRIIGSGRWTVSVAAAAVAILSSLGIVPSSGGRPLLSAPVVSTGGVAAHYLVAGLPGDATAISPNGMWVVSTVQSSPFTATLSELGNGVVTSSTVLPSGFIPLAVNDSGVAAGESANKPAIVDGGTQ